MEKRIFLLILFFTSFLNFSFSQNVKVKTTKHQGKKIKNDSIDYSVNTIFFKEGVNLSPSFIWYRNDFDDKKVCLLKNTFDSLPDEITVLLVKKGETPFSFPIKNRKTSNYGWRWNRAHRGVDIALNIGDPIHSCFDGVVRIAKMFGNYGNLIVVRHYNGLETFYGHLSKINVKPLQIVKAGEIIGLGGSTGRSTGPHLHFEVRFQYEPFDPEWILDFDNYTLRTNRLYLDKTYFGIEAPSKHSRTYYSFQVDDAESQKATKSIKQHVAPKEETLKTTTKEQYHTVSEGETLKTISEKYGITIDSLKKINNNRITKLSNNQKIRIQ